MVLTDGPTRLRVLLPGGEEPWHATVRQLLEPQGVTTVGVRSGREALELLEGREVHVAVLDEQMPQLTGMQVVRMMREKQTPVPAILLATQLTPRLLHEALGMSVFTVLGKPVDLNILLDSLARVMRRHYQSRWPEASTDMGTTDEH